MPKLYRPQHLHLIRPRSQARRIASPPSLGELLNALGVGLILFAGLGVLAFLPAIMRLLP